jgi:hypothetical protein
MYSMFWKDVAAERIADLRREADHDHLVHDALARRGPRRHRHRVRTHFHFRGFTPATHG